jgi:2-dehydro-3-deoxyphosphogluconate aldolase/(4S)-4-hydroxy-2-oxoglutarate aldolase
MENKHLDIIGNIARQKILPLFYHKSESATINVARTLYQAGVRVIEYTNRGPSALENFKSLKKLQSEELYDLILGIGTIKDSIDAENYVNAGADFLVAPVTDPAVASVAVKHGLLWIPGCMTPTEIQLAYKCGAKLVKIFPASVVGPQFITAVKDIFPGILFMATGCGELSKENLNNWFNAGACAIGAGSKLIKQDRIDNNDLQGLLKDVLDIFVLLETIC